MQLSEVVRRRRMVRRFDPERAVDPEVLRTCLAAATRAPSAGHTQGWELVVLTDADRERFWDATSAASATSEVREPDAWRRGVSAAPVLVVFCSDPQAYLERYAEPDKGWTDRDPARWPIPYWDVDTGMAALLTLLTATDHELGGLFFGVPPHRHDAVREVLGIPSRLRLVGVVALGYEAQRVRSPSLRRGRRGLDEVVHWGRYGASEPGAEAPSGEDG